jgi:hypothetical protein
MIQLVGDQGAFLALKCIRFESRTPTWAKGRTAAVSATARKLAVIIWTMIKKKIQNQ